MLDTVRSDLVHSLQHPTTEMPTRDKFSIDVEWNAKNNNLSLLDSLMAMVEDYEIDLQDVKKLISPTLMEKLAHENGIIKTSSNILPI